MKLLFQEASSPPTSSTRALVYPRERRDSDKDSLVPGGHPSRSEESFEPWTSSPSARRTRPSPPAPRSPANNNANCCSRGQPLRRWAVVFDADGSMASRPRGASPAPAPPPPPTRSRRWLASDADARRRPRSRRPVCPPGPPPSNDVSWCQGPLVRVWVCGSGKDGISGATTDTLYIHTTEHPAPSRPAISRRRGRGEGGVPMAVFSQTHA